MIQMKNGFKKYIMIVCMMVVATSISLGMEHDHKADERTLLDNLKYQIGSHRVFGGDGTFQPLSYREFVRLQETGAITPQQTGQLIKYAECCSNPILFAVSDKSIDFSSYSLNFLWLHKEPLLSPPLSHLMGDDERQFQKQIFEPIFDWQSKQPGANINFWYDSYMIVGDVVNVIDTTKEKLKQMGIILDNLNFRDIRTISIVNSHAHLFKESVEIYFRVDFAKILIADHIMRHEDVQYPITIDGDVVAVSREQLFAESTLERLNNLGCIFGATKGSGPENSFIMLNSRLALNLHFKIMIEPWLGEEPCINVYYLFSRYQQEFVPAMVAKAYEETGEWWTDTEKKVMIFPTSQHGSTSLYSDEGVRASLKAALHTN
jgi:hypothetical protein